MSGSTRRHFSLSLCILLNVGAATSAPNQCVLAYMDLKKSNPGALAIMALATGKDLPYDAGKYNMCMEVKNAHHYATSYFLVHLTKCAPHHGPCEPFEVGMCLPAACKDKDIPVMVDLATEMMKLKPGTLSIPQYSLAVGGVQPYNTVPFLNPSNEGEDVIPWGATATCATIGISLFVVMALFSTVVTVMARKAGPPAEQENRLASDGRTTAPLIDVEAEASSAPQVPPPTALQKLSKWKVVEAWSLVGKNGTWTSLWEEAPVRPTDCLNGIRVLSMVWIIVGHSFLVSEANAGYSNPEDIEASPLFNPDAAETSWGFAILLGGELGVDTFFFISGFLLSFIGVKRPTPFFAGVVLRYLRIVPAMAFMILVYSCIWPYIVHGPFAARTQQSILRKCNDGWWTNLVFTMNYWPRDPDDLCAGWTWYLGLDMIFAIVGLALLNIYKWRKSLTWMISFVLASIGFGYSIMMCYQHNLGIYMFGQHKAYTYYLYGSPWNRVSVFLVGFLLPMAMEIAKRRGFDHNTASRTGFAKSVAICASVIALGVMLFCLFAVVLDFPGPTGSGRKAMNWTKLQNALYLTFSRPLWALAYGVVTLCCYYGYLPACHAVLGHKFWQAPTKLTYNAYLLHPLFIKLAAGNSVNYFLFSGTELAYHSFGNVALAFGGAVIVWCLVEKPFATLTEHLVPKKRQVEKDTSKQPLQDNNDGGDAGALPRGENVRW